MRWPKKRQRKGNRPVSVVEPVISAWHPLHFTRALRVRASLLRLEAHLLSHELQGDPSASCALPQSTPKKTLLSADSIIDQRSAWHTIPDPLPRFWSCRPPSPVEFGGPDAARSLLDSARLRRKITKCYRKYVKVGQQGYQ